MVAVSKLTIDSLIPKNENHANKDGSDDATNISGDALVVQEKNYEKWGKLWQDYVILHTTLRKYTKFSWNEWENKKWISYRRDTSLKFVDFMSEASGQELNILKDILQYFDTIRDENPYIEKYYVCARHFCFFCYFFTLFYFLSKLKLPFVLD